VKLIEHWYEGTFLILDPARKRTHCAQDMARIGWIEPFSARLGGERCDFPATQVLKTRQREIA
jgi:hypothetical protein